MMGGGYKKLRSIGVAAAGGRKVVGGNVVDDGKGTEAKWGNG